jgi:hypothetical protein
MFIDEGIERKTVKSPIGYVVKRPLSIWLVVVRINVFLPYSYTLHVRWTFILYCRRLTGREMVRKYREDYDWRGAPTIDAEVVHSIGGKAPGWY